VKEAPTLQQLKNTKHILSQKGLPHLHLKYFLLKT
jgi:hypothetical protein